MVLMVVCDCEVIDNIDPDMELMFWNVEVAKWCYELVIGVLKLLRVVSLIELMSSHRHVV